MIINLADLKRQEKGSHARVQKFFKITHSSQYTSDLEIQSIFDMIDSGIRNDLSLSSLSLRITDILEKETWK